MLILTAVGLLAMAGPPQSGVVAATSAPQGTWTPRGAGAPPARAFASMARDDRSGDVVLFGGEVEFTQFFNDTWTWDGRARVWVPRTPRRSPLPERAYASMAYEPSGQRVLLFGGLSSGPQVYNDMWSWEAGTWVPVGQPGHRPSPREDALMAYDEAHGNIVLFGGADVQEHPFFDTWVWSGGAWSERTEAHPSDDNTPKLYGAAMAYDGQEIMLFGADASNNPATWTWDGAHWNRRSPATSPGPLRNASMTYDSALRAAILFGGVDPVAAVAVGPQGVGDPAAGAQQGTWEWDGANWTKLAPSLSPTVRSGAAMAHDPTSGAIVLQGGYAEPAEPEEMSDTWTYDLTTISNPAPAPTATRLTSSPNPSDLGQPVILTATVSSRGSPAPGSEPPQGPVTFTDGSTILGTSDLRGATARLTGTGLSAGAHSITASYHGDPAHLPSTAALTQNVRRAGQTPPSLTSITPACALEAGGTQHLLSGSGLVMGATSLGVDNQALPVGSYQVQSPTSMAMTAPAHPPGGATITVTTPSGTSNPLFLSYTTSAQPCVATQVADATSPSLDTPLGPLNSVSNSGGTGLAGGPLTPNPPGQAPGAYAGHAPVAVQALVPSSGPVTQPGGAPLDAQEKRARVAPEKHHAMVRRGDPPRTESAGAAGVLVSSCGCLMLRRRIARHRRVCARTRLALAC